MPKCIESSVYPPKTVFYHPKYMVRFTTTDRVACSVQPFINDKTVYIAASEKYINKEPISYFQPSIFLGLVYNIFELKDVLSWLQESDNLEEETIIRVMDMIWDGLLTKDALKDPEQFNLLVSIYKFIFKEAEENQIFKVLQEVGKHVNEKLSYYSNKSYYRLIKKSLMGKK